MKQFLVAVALASVAAVLGAVDVRADNPKAAVAPLAVKSNIAVRNAGTFVGATNSFGASRFRLDDDWCGTKPRIIRLPPPPPPVFGGMAGMRLAR